MQQGGDIGDRGQQTDPTGTYSQSFTIDRSARESAANHRGLAVWFTGLSGSGKSSIANDVERQLHAAGTRTYVLDGDNVRSGLCKDLGFSPEDRAENVRRISEVARLMVDAGLIVMVCLISPFADDRRKARELFAPGDLIEVFVDTPLDVCVDRDPKGLYAMSASGELANMTGIDQGYERPANPDLRLDGRQPIPESAAEVIAAVDGAR